MKSSGKRAIRKVENATEKSKTPADSAKKLVQCTLPFKIIPTASKEKGKIITPSASAEITKTEGRKRKLSFGEHENEIKSSEGKSSVEISKEKEIKRKKLHIEDNCCESLITDDDDILDDTDDLDNDNSVKKYETAKASETATISNTASPAPKVKTMRSRNGKCSGVGTPKSVNKSGKNGKNGNSGSSCKKVQIKLTTKIVGGHNKKRKLPRKSKEAIVENLPINDDEITVGHSSDDIEIMSEGLHPQKRKKLEKEVSETIDLDTETDEGKNENKAAPALSSSSQKNSENESKKTGEKESENVDEVETDEKIPDNESKKMEKLSDNDSKESDQIIENSLISSVKISDDEKESNLSRSSLKNTSSEESKENLNQSIISESNDQSTKVEDSTSSKETTDQIMVSSILKNTNKTDDNAGTPTATHNDGSGGIKLNSTHKNLTPKQLKLMEQRKKAREEKERKLQEERLQKQREKEEKELLRKRERDEREHQRRKEREEKEEVRRKEREEKEKQRLAEIEAKNEEKRKRSEAREEEIRKKDEERKRKEQEKEEAELKKKKAAEAFTKFFVPKVKDAKAFTDQHMYECEIEGQSIANEKMAFRPFQIRGDMKLAPIRRRIITPAERKHFEVMVRCRTSAQSDDDDDDEEIVRRKPLGRAQLYLAELANGKIKPQKWIRSKTESKSDDVIIVDEIESAGLQIVEETHPPVECFRAKFFKFHENRRPAYYGTWRKRTEVITPRRPLAQDKKFFDYGVDSDEEWEEEEPGESLDGTDDEKEKESEDDDYEVDNEWFVPHGHLSDEELQNEDECGNGNDNTREAQKAKLQILQQEFAIEMKKKTEKLKPRLIGCIWVDENGNQPDLCPNIIWEKLNQCVMLFNEPLEFKEPEAADTVEQLPSITGTVVPEKLKPIELTDDMLQNLVRLIHGNSNAKAFLINEFIAFLEANEDSIKNGDVRGPLKSAVREKIDEFAEWQAIETDIMKNKKKQIKKRLCWVVADEFLQKMDLENLETKNNWEYILQPKQGLTKTPIAEPGSESLKINETPTEEPPTTPKSTRKIITKKSIISQIKTSKVLETTEDDDVKQKATIDVEIEAFPVEQKVLPDEIQSKAAIQEIEKNVPDVSTASKLPSTSFVDSSTSVTSLNTAVPPVSKTTVAKKRVALLMSVPRGQQINTPTKNALISQFLQKSNKNSNKIETATAKSSPSPLPVINDEIIEISG